MPPQSISGKGLRGLKEEVPGQDGSTVNFLFLKYVQHIYRRVYIYATMQTKIAIYLSHSMSNRARIWNRSLLQLET